MKKRILYIGTAVIGILSLIYILNYVILKIENDIRTHEMNQESMKIANEAESSMKDESPQKNTELVEDKNNMDANEYYINNNIEDAVFLTGNLTLENEVTFNVNKLNIYDNNFIELNEDDLQHIVENLEKNGWKKHEYKILDQGEYIISNNEQGNEITNQKEYEKVAKNFLEDSGLSAILLDNGTQYELETIQINDSYTAFYHLLYEGNRTGSFIRMNFESDKICAECLMYLFKSELIEQLKALSFEDALKHAFYLEESAESKNDNNDYMIKNISIKYVNGLPYYNFDGYGINNRKAIKGYALAISIDESDNMERLLEVPFVE
jgi:hypothetical protein